MIIKLCGYAYRFTEIQDLKSSSGWENIKTIIIDEYAIEKNNHRYYLPNEGMLLMGLFDSILRQRSDIRVFILMNAVEGIEFSPLFSFFNLTLPYNNDIKLFKENTILLQYMNNEEYRKEREKTLIGKLAKGTQYEQYAIQNKILDKNNKYIEKKSGTAKFSFCFVYKGLVFGVWNDYNKGKVYVSKHYDKNSNHKFAVTLADHSPNMMMINALQKFNFWKNFLQNFKMGVVYFENQNIKHYCLEAIQLCSIK